MTVQDYGRLLRARWLLLLIAASLGVAGGAVVHLIRPPEFTASLTLYVSAQGGDTTQAAFQGAQLSQDRVASYTALVTNDRVTQDVINQLKLPETVRDLSKQISATNDPNSVLINVQVADPSSDRAATLVNTVGQVFTALVAELERPIQVGGVPAVAVRVVEPAVIPTIPSSLGLKIILALGLLLGLCVGVGGVLLQNALDDSVNSHEKLRRSSGVPNLGNIAFDTNIPLHPLTVHEDPHSPRSEAFRQLRTNLQFVDIDNPNKVIVVTSSMPSEGKTTTLANLAIAMAAAGSRVLVIEADLRRPRIADLLGLDRAVGLTSVLSGRIPVAQVVQQWGGGAFDVLASGPLPPNPSELLGSQHMKLLLLELRGLYDVVLVDAPPLLPVTDAAAVAPAADGVLLVCRFKKTNCGQVRLAADALNAVSARVLGTVFAMVPSKGLKAYAQYNSYYQKSSELNTHAVVPQAINRDAPDVSGITSAANQYRPRPSPRTDR